MELWQRIQAAEWRDFEKLEKEIASLFINHEVADSVDDLEWFGKHPGVMTITWKRADPIYPPRYLRQVDEALKHVPEGPFSLVRNDNGWLAAVGTAECRGAYPAQAIMGAVICGRTPKSTTSVTSSLKT